MNVKVGIGQDSHAFDRNSNNKKLVLGGVVFEGEISLKGNSDADVVLHSITNAVSGITGVNILGEISDDMCNNKGITDSKEYLKEALKYLGNFNITNVSLSIECKTPAISTKIDRMKKSISRILKISESDVNITATTGESLTSFGKGEGVQVVTVITAITE